MDNWMWVCILFFWAVFGSMFWGCAISPMQSKFGTTWKEIIVMLLSYMVLAGPIGIVLLVIFVVCHLILQPKHRG